MAQKTEILFPAGRMVMGSLYVPNDKDAEGKPLLVKNGPNTGQPRVEYFVAVAIKKGQEKVWWETPWGQLIYQTGAAAFPQACQSPTFSWKIDDGDSQIPNMRGRKPCDNEGWPGHWILKFASGYAPKCLSADGSQELTQPDAIKPGYYVQVLGSVVGNGSTQRPGIRLNPNGVALSGYAAEINVSRDFTSVGFGQGVQLPPGASATPIGGMTQPPAGFPAGPGAVPGMVGGPAGPAAMPVPGGPVPGMPAPGTPAGPAAAPLNVQPNTAFMTPPGPGPAAMPAPPAPARQMTPAAQGFSYEQWRAQGWSDQQLISAGYMTA